VTIALERGLLMPGGDGTTIVFDTVAGAVRARAVLDGARVERVSFSIPPSFVLQGGAVLRLSARQIRADIAFAGGFYAIVDSESAGVPMDGAHLAEMRRVGTEIAAAAEAAAVPLHPLDERLRGIDGTVFTGPPHAHGADLRCVMVSRGGGVSRGAPGTAAAAILGVLDAIGLLENSEDDARFVCEGLAGQQVAVRIAGRTMVGDYNALMVIVEGTAWITGDHTFSTDDRDPFAAGFVV
jgi:proline racemase